MVSINCNLLNLSYSEILLSIFGEYIDEFDYTADGIFRRILPPACPNSGSKMPHNGYNASSKKWLGSVKIGSYICPYCREPYEEKRTFWEKLKCEFFGVIDTISQLMWLHHVSYQGISSIKGLIFPRGKNTIFRKVANKST